MNITVELSDFSDEEIESYAKKHLGMMTDIESLELYDVDELVEELEGRGYIIIDRNYYPYNDLITADLLQRVNDNIGKIDRNDLEEFLQKRGL